MTVIGVGLDIVDIEAYTAQLEHPGTTMRRNFSAQEWEDAEQATNRSKSLAGRWAAKEAVIKAWSVSRYGQPPKIAPYVVQHQDIEVTTDTWNRPRIKLHGQFAEFMAGLHIHISISHDGNVAAAVAIIEQHADSATIKN